MRGFRLNKKTDEKPKSTGRNRTAGEILEDMNENPEKYGTTAEHIKAVDKKVKNADAELVKTRKIQKERNGDDDV